MHACAAASDGVCDKTIKKCSSHRQGAQAVSLSKARFMAVAGSSRELERRPCRCIDAYLKWGAS